MKKTAPTASLSPTALIDQRIADLADWRGTTLARMRKLIHQADPHVVEEWKWMGTPVWEHDGIICTGESYKGVVKLTFHKGAALKDPAKLFNASLEGNARRAIDIREGETIDATAFKALIREAVALNTAGKQPKVKSTATKTTAAKPTAAKSTAAKPTAAKKARKPASLPKSDGDAGVRAFIASMEPWQGALAKRVDALAAKHVPKLRRAVRWHVPFYGIEGNGWFLAFAAFQRHVKFTFFKGTSLTPVPPLGTGKEGRSIDLREDDTLDEKQFVAWLKQAAKLPGWDGGARR